MKERDRLEESSVVIDSIIKSLNTNNGKSDPSKLKRMQTLYLEKASQIDGVEKEIVMERNVANIIYIIKDREVTKVE